MPELPQDLATVRAEIVSADARADTVCAGLADAQFHWRPDDGRAWSVALCLDHLIRANRAYMDAMRPSLDRALREGWTRRGPIASNIVGRWFVRTMEPPVRSRMRAPRAIVPSATGSREEILLRFHDVHRELVDLVDACAGVDVNRATFASPFLRLAHVRLGTAFRILAAHDRRHLWQAAQVIARPEFPRGPS
jgi:hypothetical protein